MEVDYSEQIEFGNLQNITLRNYQINALERSKNQNSIIFLPTGSGKTLIAVQLLCSRTLELVGDFPENSKRAFFVAPTKLLVYQLYKTISIHTKFKVGFYVGDMLVSFWEKEKWMEELQRNHVIVLTAEILRQILEMNIITPKQISLIVFDECHHAALQHPYKIILDFIAKEPISTAPLVLGLSAVLLNANPKKKNIVEIINSLKNMFRGQILTDCKEVFRFRAAPNEIIINYTSSVSLVSLYFPLYDEAIDLLNNLDLTPLVDSPVPKDSTPYLNTNQAKRLKNWFGIIKIKNNIKMNAKDMLVECGLYVGSLSVLYYIILTEKYRLMSFDPRKIQVLIYCRTVFYKIRHVLLGALGEETVENILRCSSNKVRTLLDLLISKNNEKPKNKYRSTLIFVQRKDAAVTIATFLKRLKDIDSSFSFLKPGFIIGCGIFDKETLSLKLNNEEIIKELASQNLNTLVCTSVLQEGIDIPSCDVVISFNFPNSYSSYFQSKGRARHKEAFYYAFVESEEQNQKTQLISDYHQIEEELYEILKKEDKFHGSSEEISPEDDSLSTTCIKAVYRYCAKLPQDKYSFLSPVAWYKEYNEGKQAFVQLPLNCPLQDVIKGKVMANSRLAKKSVYFEVLKELKKIGEIDESFSPVTCKEKAKSYSYLFPHFQDETPDKNLPLPGSRKRKRIYEAKMAESLSKCLPQPGMTAYLHVIDFAINFYKIERADKLALQEILQNPTTFAILSSKKLYKICQFPLFLGMGRIDCNLLVNHDKMVLSKTDLEDIKLCHFAVFQKLLRIIKDFQIFDNRNQGHSFYVVPVKKTETGRYALDWEIIRCDFCRESKSAVVRYNPFHSRKVKGDRIDMNSSGESFGMTNSMVKFVHDDNFYVKDSFELNRKPQFTISEADYKYFVISPNYRNIDPPQIYIVTKFCHDLSPMSPFPNLTYKDYFTYYQAKYAIEISNVRQPLVKVAFIFPCSNFNKPRNYQEKVKGLTKNQEEILVPELCDVLPFDRRYWVKAHLLPTALNRIYHLFCVEEFRRKIITETGLGEVELPCNTEWKPLDVHLDFKNDHDENEDNPEALKTALPLSKLKGKAQQQMEYVDFNRRIVDVSVCDLEYFFTPYKEKFKNDMFDLEFLPPKISEASSRLKRAEEIQVPPLQTLKRTQNQLGPDLAQLVETFTAAAANDIVNYERLEILGDAFLKFAVSNFLFKNFKLNEGMLTFLKGKLVGNRNLLHCGLAKGFQHVVNVNDFAPLCDWNPPLVCLPDKLVQVMMANNIDPAVLYRWNIPSDEQFSGNLSPETLTKNEEITKGYNKACGVSTNSLLPYTWLKDKIISDSVEAVIGVYLLTFGLHGGFEILKWLDILPKSSGSYSEVTENVLKPSVTPCERNTSSPDNKQTLVMNILREVFYSSLEEILGYEFKNKALLLEAITHPSYARNRITDCYQRLEFLGDAILDFLITSYIYQYCGHLTPGDVTDIRSSLVNNLTFASLAVRYDFHKYLLKLSSNLNKAVEEFVEHQASNNYVVDDSVLFFLEENDCFIAESVQVPKALGDLFESLAGAIYLDSGCSLETVWAIYYRLMKNEIDTFTKTTPKNPLRLLHEICDEKPLFEMIPREDTVQVKCTARYGNCEITVHGFGCNKNEAKKSAAKLAVKKISELKSPHE